MEAEEAARNATLAAEASASGLGGMPISDEDEEEETVVVDDERTDL
jgi:hypothetical protein